MPPPPNIKNKKKRKSGEEKSCVFVYGSHLQHGRTHRMLFLIGPDVRNADDGWREWALRDYENLYQITSLLWDL